MRALFLTLLALLLLVTVRQVFRGSGEVRLSGPGRTGIGGVEAPEVVCRPEPVPLHEPISSAPRLQAERIESPVSPVRTPPPEKPIRSMERLEDLWADQVPARWKLR